MLQSLDTDSAKTCVHAFITSSVDYCLISTTYRLQRVLNVAARVISGTGKFNRGLM